MRNPLADALVAVERRLLSLERRFRELSGRMIRRFIELDDVPDWPDLPGSIGDLANVDTGSGTDQVVWGVQAPPPGGDTLTWAPVRLSGGSGGGIVSYIRVSDGVKDIGMDFVDDDRYIPDPTSTGVQVWAAGLYLVHARGFYGSTVKIQVTGDSFDGDSSNCVANVATDYGGDSSSASAIFPLPENASIDVVATSDGSPSWTLDVALLVETWIEPGVCL